MKTNIGYLGLKIVGSRKRQSEHGGDFSVRVCGSWGFLGDVVRVTWLTLGILKVSCSAIVH